MTKCTTDRQAALAAATVLIIGMVAAVGAGKLPPALMLLAAQFDMTLFEASFLIGLFQFGGALGGVFFGTLADRFGHRNIMQAGMAMTLVGIVLALSAQSSTQLLVSRAIESIGFMFTVLPGPAVLRQVIAPARLKLWLGGWGTYMPVGFALALLAGPWLMQAGARLTGAGQPQWAAVWGAHGLLIIMCWVALRLILPIPVARTDSYAGAAPRFVSLLSRTLRSRGPWLLAGLFAAYAGQYLSIVSFLPTIYEQAGLSLAAAGALTALVAGINLFGNLAAGRLTQRGINPGAMLMLASIALLLGAWLVFLTELSFAVRYACVVAMSACIGLIPGTLFVLAPRYAPDTATVSSTVGLMQQGSSAGQLLLPPLVAWSAGLAGGWSNAGWVLGAMALLNLLLAAVIWLRERPGQTDAAQANG